jgi:hypothetical protein
MQSWISTPFSASTFDHRWEGGEEERRREGEREEGGRTEGRKKI